MTYLNVGASHWNHGDCTKRYIWIKSPAPPYQRAAGRFVSFCLQGIHVLAISSESERTDRIHEQARRI